MQTGRFLAILGVLTLVVILLLTGFLYVFPALRAHTGFSFGTVGIFFAFSLGAFLMGKSAVKSANKYRFIQVLILIIMGKILISLLAILAYMKLTAPPDKGFVLPFIAIYLIYTVFEVYYLEKVAKEEPEDDLQGDHK